jgi:predicted peptidase
MRLFFTIAAAILIASLPAQDMPKNQVEKSFKARSVRDLEIQYLLFLPKNYKSSQKWPLMLFLHGAGERGANINKVTVHGPPKIIKSRPDFPFIVVSPQCPAGKTWDDEVLLALLDEITATYAVDTNRVYLTGLSMGGFGTWSLGLKHPERFAAIAPICGGGNTLDVLLPETGKQSLLKKLPVWAFHGGKDPVVNVHESERMVQALKSLGNDNVKLTIYPDAGHDSWTETYDNQELYDWLLKQSRSGRAPGKR